MRLVVGNESGKTIAIQVERATKGRNLVARERRAIEDLRRCGEFDHVFFIEYK